VSFSLRRRAQSFIYAWRGLRTVLATQRNAWMHLAATIAVLAAGIWVRLSRAEWCAIVVAVALVWMAEAFNTALELLADEISLEKRERLGRAKDAAAAAVLCAAVAALVIGAIVFAPHVAEMMR
jgi:diacylglycerol kinase (ATP)